MQSSNGQTIARIGGAALAASVLLPWFVLEFEQVASMGFSLREMERNAAIILVVVGFLCMAQPKLGSADASAMAYLAIGGLVTAAIVYKVFVSPPGSQYMNDLQMEGVSLKELLNSIGIEFKASYGAFLGLAGGVAIAVGSLMQVRSGGVKDLGLSVEQQAAFDALRPKTSAKPVVLAPGQQRYVAPQPQQYAMQPPPSDFNAPTPPPQ